MHNQLLTAIKNDDLFKFKGLIENRRGLMSISYGRFPVLSVCYVYGSMKILKEFENQLFAIKNYNIVEEDLQTYNIFKKKAQRCLRFYIDDKLVTPYDMLAVLGESLHIIEKSKRFEPDQETNERITTIFNTLHSQQVKNIDNRLIIDKKRLSKQTKAYVWITVIIVLFVMLLSGGAWYGYEKAFGNGSVNNPYRIAGENQLIEAISKSGGNYYLAKDIRLEKDWEIKDFVGYLDGRGHTIYASNKIKTGFIDELDGRIENISFEMDYTDWKINQDIGLIANTNNGKLNDITVAVNATFYRGEAEDGLYFSCLTYQNEGEINDVEIQADITFINEITKDIYLSGIASINNGKIEGCSTSEDSKFICDTVDVSGIVIDNNLEITNSKNQARLTHTTTSESWYPHASGIAMTNYGDIKECENMGDIKVGTQGEENIYEAYAGGITCVNIGKVIKSKNHSKIKGISKNSYIYIGGIAAQNMDYYSLVENSCSYGEISITIAEDEIFSFAGGIVGYALEGRIKDCYSLNKIESPNEYVFVGGIMGMGRMLSNLIIAPIIENCYYLEREQISYGIGCVLDQNGMIHDGSVLEGQDTVIEVVDSLEELKEKEVYWG